MSSDEMTWIDGYRGAVVLVTGASGFIGSRLLPPLISGGARVHTLARRPVAAPQVESHTIDVTDRDAVRALFRRLRPDFVFHLAGRTNASKGLEHVEPTFETNAIGTLNVLLGAADSARSCRMLCCGSMEELWGDQMAKSSPYGVSKSVASTYVGMFHTLYGMAAFSLRPFFVYGPGPQPADKLVPYVVTALIEHRLPTLKSPHRAMDWVYIDDVAEAFLRAGLAPAQALNGVVAPIDIGCGSLCTIAEVVGILAELLGSRVDVASYPAADTVPQASPVADTETAFRLFGWRCTMPLRQGLEHTVRWYKENQ